jgi:hypothetical protein
MFNDPSAQEKFDKMINLLKETYYKSSNIENILNIVTCEDEPLNKFSKFGIGIKLPKYWFTDPSYYPNMVFEQIGSNLSFSEIKYITQKIPEISRIEPEIIELNPDTLVNKIFNICSYQTLNKITIFIPINFYVKFHTEWATVSALRLDFSSGKFYIGDTNIRIIWSNKYNDFKDVILINKDAGLWGCKKQFDERLDVNYVLNEDGENIDLIVETLFHFNILLPEKIYIISPTNTPQGPL